MHSTSQIGWFAHIGLADRSTVGGKGGSLGELTQAGIPVPDGFVVRTAAFENFIDTLERQEPLRSRVEGLAPDDLEGITRTAEELRARVASAPLPDALRAELPDALAVLCAGEERAPLAVRSMKRMMLAQLGWDVERAAMEEALAQAATLETDDVKEGIAALLEKRAPVFVGR